MAAAKKPASDASKTMKSGSASKAEKSAAASDLAKSKKGDKKK